MNRSDDIVEQGNTVLGYLDRLWMSVLHAARFFVRPKENWSVVLELER